MRVSKKNLWIIPFSSAKPVSGLFLALLILTSFPVEASEVKFMVYNIQIPNWSQERRENINEIIMGYLPDVIGLNEFSANSSAEAGEDLVANGYTAYTGPNESTIYVRDAANLTYVDDGSLALTPCGNTRYMAWVRFIENDSGQEFIFANTHLCVDFSEADAAAQVAEAQEIAGELDNMDSDDVVILLGGDLNASEGGDIMNFFLDQVPLDGVANPIDLDDTCALFLGDPDSSACDGTVGGGGTKIDWLMVEAGEMVIEASVIQEAAGDASDHLAVTATIEFGEPGNTPPVANIPPVANDDVVETDQDVAVTIPDVDLLANDTDVDGDPLNITAIDNAMNGTVAFSNDDIIFTPDPGFLGSGSFTYDIDDGNGGMDTATVTVAVNTPGNTPGNIPPVANDDYVVGEGQRVLIQPEELLANDADADGDVLSVISVDNAVNGRARITRDGAINFMTGRRFSGDGSFQYTIDDGNGGTDTATVTVSIP